MTTALKNIRYDEKSTNLEWRFRKECWYSNQYKHSMIFYQRSMADVWFKEITSNHYLNMVPKGVLESYRNNIMTLNQALERIEDDDVPSTKQFNAATILDPILIAKFEICEHR